MSTQPNVQHGASTEADGAEAVRAATPPTELSPEEKRLTTFALMLAMAVAALEQTVVSPAMPSIVAELKGVRIYPWVSSVYLLAFTISTPLYGKLADLWGRKRLLLFGLALFLVGSALSGASISMPMLIAMRLVQGLGFGAIMPIVLTIIGDVFTLRERARVQGWFSSVWGVSGLIGPLIGGYLTDFASWRWVFFVTLPFGLFAMVVLSIVYHERLECDRRSTIDWPGALLLAAITSSLMLAMLGPAGWPAPVRWGIGIAALPGVGLFIWWEKRARDPVLPLDLFGMRTVVASIGGCFIIGALMLVIEVYLPLYVQGVRGGSAVKSGTQLTPLLVAWSISVIVAARAVIRFGYRNAAAVGGLLVTTGVAVITLGTTVLSATDLCFTVGMALLGTGMGPASLSFILSVQNAVPWERRGVATGALSYFRTMGGAMIVAFFGAILAYQLAHALPARLNVSAALRPETHHLLAARELSQVRDALRGSLRAVFTGTTLLAALVVAFGLNLPRSADDHIPSAPKSDGELP